jgi:hypothetical protein
MVMKELHASSSRGNFTTEITQRKILDARSGGQLCTKLCMITVDLMMHVKE